MPFGGAGLDRHARAAEAAVEQQLDDQAAEGVADQHRRLVELADQRLVVVDDLAQAEARELVGVVAQLLDVAVLARPLGRRDARSRACRSSRSKFSQLRADSHAPWISISGICDVAIAASFVRSIESAATLRRVAPDREGSIGAATQTLRDSIVGQLGPCGARLVSQPPESRSRSAALDQQVGAVGRRQPGGEVDREAQRRIERQRDDARARLRRPSRRRTPRPPRRSRRAACAGPTAR